MKSSIPSMSLRFVVALLLFGGSTGSTQGSTLSRVYTEHQDANNRWYIDYQRSDGLVDEGLYNLTTELDGTLRSDWRFDHIDDSYPYTVLRRGLLLNSEFDFLGPLWCRLPVDLSESQRKYKWAANSILSPSQESLFVWDNDTLSRTAESPILSVAESGSICWYESERVYVDSHESEVYRRFTFEPSNLRDFASGGSTAARDAAKLV